MNICTLYICIFIIFYKFYLVFMYLTIHDMEKLKIDSRYDSCFDNWKRDSHVCCGHLFMFYYYYYL